MNWSVPSYLGLWRNIESAIQFVINDWMEAIDEDRVTGEISFDLKRAFESIDRGRLIKVLEHLRFRRPMLNWLKDYLS